MGPGSVLEFLSLFFFFLFFSGLLATQVQVQVWAGPRAVPVRLDLWFGTM